MSYYFVIFAKEDLYILVYIEMGREKSKACFVLSMVFYTALSVQDSRPLS